MDNEMSLPRVIKRRRRHSPAFKQRVVDECRQPNTYIAEVARIADTFVSCYPNAGLPNPLSPTGYDETPEQLAQEIVDWAQHGFVNIVGGCCGTTPAHLRAVVDRVGGRAPADRTPKQDRCAS